MTADKNTVQKGVFTDDSPLYPDLLAMDTRTPSAALHAVGEFMVEGGQTIPRSRYFDPDYAAREMEHVWKKTWQIAAREEDIPEIGDRVTYDVGALSFIIVRSGPEQFHAFYNSCLHRGTKLCKGSAGGDTVKCPFHGWEWNLDGSVHNLPGRWDFPGVTDETHKLPQVNIARWGGNLFINPDPNAKPLETALGVLADHFKDYAFENRWTAVRLRKKIRANWKVAMEAFLEGWHLSETHGQAQSFNGDSNSQYDVWEDEDSQVSRSITPSGVPSPELGPKGSVRQAVIDMIKAVTPPGIELPDFDKVENLDRAYGAEWRRKVLTQMTGRDFSDQSDADMLDAVQYFMFPNFFPWYGEGAPLSYQFMPYGSDPNESVMGIRYTLPLPADGVRPPAAPLLELDFDQTLQDNNAGFGLFDEVFDQDMSNLELIQEGLKTGSPASDHVVLGVYQECRIKSLHARIERLINQ